MITIQDRLQALKDKKTIAGFQEPQPNHGLAGGLLPWVIMPHNGGPASTYYNEHDLERDVKLLETFGPINFALGVGMLRRYGPSAWEL